MAAGITREKALELLKKYITKKHKIDKKLIDLTKLYIDLFQIKESRFT